jgi:hypothetical protein
MTDDAARRGPDTGISEKLLKSHPYLVTPITLCF